MPHTCHAEGCKIAVPPRMFMHIGHWRMLPRSMQRAIWAAYVPGQENRKDPSEEYLEAAHNAIEYIATREGLREGKKGKKGSK